MNTRQILLMLGLVAASSTLPAQSTTTSKLAPLDMDPPSGILTSVPLGALPADQVLHLTVAMPFGDPDGINQFVNAVSDPKNPMYRQFLTPQQVAGRFGLRPTDIAKVTSYLTSQGMKVEEVASNGLAISVNATVAQVNGAFHTSVEAFKSMDPALANGPLFAYTITPSVPAEIRPFVNCVAGLDDFNRPTPANLITPAQMQTFYNVLPMIKAGSPGKGRTVGISNWDGYRLSGLPTVYSQWDLPKPSGGVGSNVTVKVPSGDQGGGNATEAGEGDIDIQSVLNMAPLCNLIIYDDGGGSANDLLGVLSLEATDNKADIITESYGWIASPNSYYISCNNEHVSMSAEGITYMNASGDHGTSGVPGDPYPDMDPQTLVVGGTTTNTNSNTGALVSTDGWSGSAGGWVTLSETFNKLQSWQKGTGVPTNENFRLFPDVALNADPNSPMDYYLQSVGWHAFGGTSCASPTFAGCLADAEAQIITWGGLAGGSHRFGQIMPLIYSFNGNSRIFNDVKSGSNGTLPNGSTSNCTPGWDFVTGWGTVNFSELADAEAIQASSYSATPSTLEGGASFTGKVLLNGTTPAAGTVITLSASDPSLVETGTVSIGSGYDGAQFTQSTSSVSANTNVTLYATTYGWATVATTITLTPPQASNLTLNDTSVYGGVVATATVTIGARAPSGGLKVALSSSNSSVASCPSSVTVPAGATSATFSVTTYGVNSNTSATISASSGGVTKTVTISVYAGILNTFSINPNSVVYGSNSTGTAYLTGYAGSAGRVITLKSSNTSAATVPSSITVGSGKLGGTFTITTHKVNVQTNVTITATLGNAVTATLTLTVPQVSSIGLNETTVNGGVVATGTVKISEGAPTGGLTVALASSNTGAATVPSSVTIAQGATSATFPVTTLGVNANSSSTISASSGGATKSTTINVEVGVLNTFTISPTSVVYGTNSTGTVVLTGYAGPNGRVVTFKSSDASAATVPASVTVPSGKSSATFTITTHKVNAQTNVTITATLGSAKVATLTVKT